MSRLKKMILDTVTEAVTAQVRPDRKWGNFKTVNHMYGWSRNALNDLVKAGEVRACKTANSPAGGVLYRLADIEEWMEDNAKGRVA
jgi:hypothetical protein